MSGITAVDRCRLDRLALMPEEREILVEYLAHNINNALQVITAEIALRARAPRWDVIDDALGRVRRTIEGIGGGGAGTGDGKP